jgi:hypothetical protein
MQNDLTMTLQWQLAPYTKDVWTAHAGHLVGNVQPSHSDPEAWYWRIHPDGCENPTIATDIVSGRDAAIEAAELAMKVAAFNIQVAFAPTPETT